LDFFYPIGSTNMPRKAEEVRTGWKRINLWPTTTNVFSMQSYTAIDIETACRNTAGNDIDIDRASMIGKCGSGPQSLDDIWPAGYGYTPIPESIAETDRALCRRVLHTISVMQSKSKHVRDAR
jgi:hypothetical protein